MTTMENALGFSYWKKTAPEDWDPLDYHKYWVTNGYTPTKGQVVLAAKKQLEWLSMHGNQREKQADLKKNGRIYQFWGSDVVSETQIRTTRAKYKLTVANEVTEQMTSVVQTATNDIKRSFPGHEDNRTKRICFNKEVDLSECDDGKEEDVEADSREGVEADNRDVVETDSREVVEADSREGDAVKNLLDESRACSNAMQKILVNFRTYKLETNNILLENGIMDLRPSSEFVLLYTEETDYDNMLQDVFDPIDKLFPEETYEFLTNFFSEKLSAEQWEVKIGNLMEADPEESAFSKRLRRLMIETLPVFFDSYKLMSDNPLKDRDMSEEEYMNAFIHPILKKALIRFADVRYISGSKAIKASAYRKSVTSQKGNADRADGIAYTSNQQNSYEISVTEGSRPYVTDPNKETTDFIQNARAAKDMINFVVTQEVMLKRALPSYFRTFMVQSIELQLRFYFMDYLCQHRVFEIETCEVPTDWTETNLFPTFYRAIVTWALLVGETDKQFQASRSKRSSRLSNCHNIRKLTKLPHNKARPAAKKDMKMAKLL